MHRHAWRNQCAKLLYGARVFDIYWSLCALSPAALNPAAASLRLPFGSISDRDPNYVLYSGASVVDCYVDREWIIHLVAAGVDEGSLVEVSN